MKKMRLLVTLSLAAGLGACSAGSDEHGAAVVEVERERTLGVTWEQYRDSARVAADGADFYRVEWDLFFRSEAELREHYEQLTAGEERKLAVFQRLSTGFEPTYPAGQAVQIKYCISNNHTNKAQVSADMRAAAEDWAAVANVRFSYEVLQDSSCGPTNANVHFAVLPTTQSGLAGCGSNKMMWISGCPYTGGMANGVLSVNYAAFPQFPGLTGRGLFRHELGHILGFRHEHPWAPSFGGCGETPTDSASDVTGRRLTAYDRASVMHYPQCSGFAGTDFVISATDGTGVRSIYGMPVGWYASFI